MRHFRGLGFIRLYAKVQIFPFSAAYAEGSGIRIAPSLKVISVFFDIAAGVSSSELLNISFEDVDLTLANYSNVWLYRNTYAVRAENSYFYKTGTAVPTSSVYRKVSDIGQVADGYYMLVGTNQIGNTVYTAAMGNDEWGGRLNGVGVTIMGDAIISPHSSTVWNFAEQETPGCFAVSNANNNWYVNIVDNTTAGLRMTAEEPEYYFNLSYAGGSDPSKALLKTTALGDRAISIYKYDFRSYQEGNAKSLYLYKCEGIPDFTAPPSAPPSPPMLPLETYELVTNINEITDGGEYVLVGQTGTTSYAMTNTLNSAGRMNATEVSVVDGCIVDNDPDIVWSFWQAGTANTFYIQKSTANECLGITKNAVGGYALGENVQCTFTVSSTATANAFRLRSNASAANGRSISIYEVDFRAYLDGDWRPLYLYKKVSE